MTTSIQFNCDRTCIGRREACCCRFNPVMQLAGISFANSNTTTVECVMEDEEVLRYVVEDMGGVFHGRGSFRLFSSTVSGVGFQLSGWRYPLVVTEGGKLAYDDYGGQWGNPADIRKLFSAYGREALRRAAESLGWTVTQLSQEAIEIAHPSGGAFRFDGGELDALGIRGTSCHEQGSLLMAAAGLKAGEVRLKPEYSQVEQPIFRAE